MGILEKTIKLFLGSKSDKDRKLVQPFVEQIKQKYVEIDKMTNDELREASASLRRQIAEFIAPEEKEIAALKRELEQPEPAFEQADIREREKAKDKWLADKESKGKRIEELKKEVNRKIEEKLYHILPDAFAIMKSTARRFAQSEEIVVTANQFDKDLAARKDFVSINENGEAVYKNSWIAGGNLLTWNMVHYDSQLFGGVVLHLGRVDGLKNSDDKQLRGRIAEMATGEGKTLVATLPVFLNALAGKGVHVVTVNDYLSRRDCEWMGPMYQFHGLTVDCIDMHKPNTDERRRAYQADITFGTNNEFGFDYLRDNMASSPADLVQRENLHYAIVDEADSILIDDARTPLIISGPVPKGEDQMFEQYCPVVERLYNLQKNFATQLVAEARKLINEGKTEEGGIILYRAHKGLPKYKPLIKYLSEPGVKVLMQKTENVYMADNNRRMPEITDELYFVIDEKLHSVELTDKGHEILSKSVGEDNFFVLPNIGEAVAELEKADLTAEEKAAKRDEVINDYAVKSERVHTVQQLLKAYAMFEKDVEYVVMDNKVKIVDEQTGRILDGRRYSDGLHQAIEAKEHVKVEAATQTFATITLQNYFRMYHKLSGMTGTAETEASEFWSIYGLDVVVIPPNRPIIRDDRDDLIYKTKREKYNAVIDEITATVKTGRPVLVGTTSVEISELLSRMLKLRGIKHNVLNAKQHQLEAQVVLEAGRAGQVTIATNMAGRGTDIKLPKEVIEAGGLAIIGTERHESRRVDRQLRGRAGRQGDPGSSQFFVSLEDDLMRLFGGDRMQELAESLKMPEDMPLDVRLLSNRIEGAQKQIEDSNFKRRKYVLSYDDVMNQQRTVIYKQRQDVLNGEDISETIEKMLISSVEEAVATFTRDESVMDWDLDGLRAHYLGTLTTEEDFHYDDDQRKKLKREELIELLTQRMMELYETKEKLFGEETFREVERAILLRNVDTAWMEHIDVMEDLKGNVGLQAYAQRDPINEYRIQGADLFDMMVGDIRQNTVRTILSVVPQEQPIKRVQVAKPLTAGFEGNRNVKKTVSHRSPTTVVNDGPKIGRNDPCPCGSGKKYKNCCMRNEE